MSSSATTVSLRRWLRRQLREPTPQRERLEAAIENDDPAEVRTIVARMSFNDAQREGLRLFSQSCGVCHTVVQQRTRQYGPVLSRETLGGDEELIREYIGNGTPRMPGFRYYFEPAHINSIVAYIKTIPVPATPAGAK